MLTVPMVSERLKCSPQTVYTLIRTGRLPATRRLANPRGAWLVKPEALEQFEAEQLEPATAGVA
jgi:excisionase family DNA binding protein